MGEIVKIRSANRTSYGMLQQMQKNVLGQCTFLYGPVAAELSSLAEIQTGPHDQSVKQVEHGRQEAFASPACLKKRNLL